MLIIDTDSGWRVGLGPLGRGSLLTRNRNILIDLCSTELMPSPDAAFHRVCVVVSGPGWSVTSHLSVSETIVILGHMYI